MAVKPWQEVSKEMKGRVRDAIPKEWILKNPPPESQTNVMDVPRTSGILTQAELDITEKDATELIQLMTSGKLKSYDVTLAFCKRAAIAEQVLNCLSQVFFDEGLQRAKEIDEEFAKTGKPVGPFHGCPFSVKTHWNIKGKEASSAYVAWAYKTAEEDAPTVAILRAAGAVFYCKTTAPQSLMHLETVSNLWGRTLNPFNRKLSPGGSSGGESALVSFRGSPIGLSADGGGSIRAPAANCGLVGLKATSNRIPVGGNNMLYPGASSFPVVGGPVCHSVRDQNLFMKTILDAEPWKTEPELPPVPWRPYTLPKKVTFGFYSDDGICAAHPPIVETIKMLKKLLADQPDIDVVDFKPFDHARGYDNVRRLYFQDGGEQEFQLFEEAGEPVLDLSAWIMKRPTTKRYTLEETWAQRFERESYRKEYAAYWAKEYPEVDFIICPVTFATAPRHETAKCWSYTAIYNDLDWPACAFPTGLFVDPAKYPKPDYKPRDNEFEPFCWSTYEPEEFRDSPISLQMVGKKWECEGVMAAVEKVTAVLKQAAQKN